MVISSASKSVKFQKAQTPGSSKKKFVKTPHSLKTPKTAGSPNDADIPSPMEKKKRKLSFNNLPAQLAPDSDDDEEQPKVKTPRLTPAKTLKNLTPAKTSKNLTPAKTLKNLTPAKTSKNLTPAKILKKTTPAKQVPQKEETSSDEFESDIEPSDEVDSNEDEIADTSEDNSDVEDSSDQEELPEVPPLPKKATPAKVTAVKKVGELLTHPDVSSAKKENTVFVGNLPTTVTNDKIIKLFSQFGKVVSARLRCAALIPKAKNKKSGTILKQFQEGSSIAAFVKFTSLDSAKKALMMNGQVYKDHHLRVDLADTTLQSSTDKNKAVFVRNLPFKLTDDQLWNAFESCGKIASVRIIRDKYTFKGRGMGYVNFESADSVELALKMAGSSIGDRPIDVQRWGEKKATTKDGKKKIRKQKKEPEVKSEVDGASSDFTGNKSAPKKRKGGKKSGKVTNKQKKMAEILGAS